MVTRDRDLPRRPQLGAHHLAGHGRAKARPERVAVDAWRAQLQRWGLRAYSAPHDRRLWRVVAAPAAGGQCVRLLPTERREILIYPDGAHVFRPWRKPEEVPIQGPWYVLTFRDARALWADRCVELRPAVDGEWLHTPQAREA